MAEYQIGVLIDGETMSALESVLREVWVLNDAGQWDGFRDDLHMANAFVSRVREAFIDSVGGGYGKRDAQGAYRVSSAVVREADAELEKLLDEEQRIINGATHSDALITNLKYRW